MAPKVPANNARAAAIFFEVSEILRIRGEKFKPQAYLRAAKAIGDLPRDIAEIDKEGKLEDIPGVGTHIAAKIREILRTGGLSYLENLKKELPEGVAVLSGLEGIGPKKAMVLSRTLGITSVAGLEEAAQAGKIRDLPGFGELSEKNILRSIRAGHQWGQRFLLGRILPVAQDIVQRLAADPATRQVSLAGSLRRKKETIGDVDIVAASGAPGKIMDLFCSLPAVGRVLVRGPTRSSVLLSSGVQVDLRVVQEEQYGAALQYFTGSKDHNIVLRRRALERNWKLNEYGITDLPTGKRMIAKSEEEVYRMLDLPYIEPELRENRGEVEAALGGTLPVPLPYDAIRGDLHVHSSWSDGSHSILEMARAAQARGYAYIAVCDHTKALRSAHGLDEGKIAEQQKEIEQVNRKLDGFEVLAGTECDIGTDGSLDIGNKVLHDLDVVVASVHSGLKMGKEEQTQRVLAAMHNDAVDIIGHPTGRILLKREGVQIDLDRIYAAAAELRVILEVNAYPERLDLPDLDCIDARNHGIRFSIGSDAHALDDLRFMEFGVATARRGWLEAKDVVNTRALGDIRTLLRS